MGRSASAGIISDTHYSIDRRLQVSDAEGQADRCASEGRSTYRGGHPPQELLLPGLLQFRGCR